MKSLADELPPEIARQIHPEWRKNEAAYWDVRDTLLDQYRGQWIGFADGRVVASGSRPVVVFHAAHRAAAHPFCVCVGRESEPFRMRRATFAFDATYPGQPLPVIRAEFRQSSGMAGVVFDRVIPDTGADTSALPWTDCQTLNLDFSQGDPSFMAGVAGGSAMTVAFTVWVYLDGNEYESQLLADFDGNDRILGRDVLNSLEILFRGPSGEVVVNP
jgi:predicted aspartyl protease